MLIDFDNNIIIPCDYEEEILCPVEENYIPASTWGFIQGDISKQKDLLDLIDNIESGLTPEQIELLSNTSNIINEFKTDYYTKREVDNIISNIEVGDVDLTGYATEQWVEDKGYLTEHQSLVDYATKQWVLYNYYLKGDVDELLNDTKDWVTEQGYLAEGTILSDYYTKEEIDNAFANIEIGITPEQIEIINNLDDKFAGIEYDLSELTSELGDKASADSVYNKDEIDSKHYATERWVENKGYLTEHQSLTGYYTKSEVDNIVSNIEVGDVDLTGYATEQWVEDKNYLTEHQDISHLATKEEVADVDFFDIKNNPITNAEEGNLIIVDEAGNIGLKLDSYSNLIVKDVIAGDNILSNKADKSELEGLVTEKYVDDKFSSIEIPDVDLTGYATEQWVEDKGYLTEHQSLNGYYTKSETDNLLSNKLDTNNIWSGTQAEWDNLSTEQQASYIIAMIKI